MDGGFLFFVMSFRKVWVTVFWKSAKRWEFVMVAVLRKPMIDPVFMWKGMFEELWGKVTMLMCFGKVSFLLKVCVAHISCLLWWFEMGFVCL